MSVVMPFYSGLETLASRQGSTQGMSMPGISAPEIGLLVVFYVLSLIRNTSVYLSSRVYKPR